MKSVQMFPQAHWVRDILLLIHLEGCPAIILSGHFLESKGRTTAGEEFRSWHALVLTGGPGGHSL